MGSKFEKRQPTDKACEGCCGKCQNGLVAKGLDGHGKIMGDSMSVETATVRVSKKLIQLEDTKTITNQTSAG